ncbi:hypothetical protein Sjap_022013 [Stephania japonica]|uniref:Uncharacterized protein n=1 Tax=Stephania japonica TaxID=461633 RepID=A0AAP0EN24_9MAGN
MSRRHASSRLASDQLVELPYYSPIGPRVDRACHRLVLVITDDESLEHSNGVHGRNSRNSIDTLATSWIREEEITDGRHYGGYDSSHDSDLDVDFDKRDCLNLSYIYQHGAPDDEHEAPRDDEVEQELPA